MVQPLVSAILPVYKGNIDWIKESVDSILNQSYENIELIVVNDFPTEEEKEYFSSLEKKNNKVKYYKNLKKTSLGHGRNQGIGLSKGKYIALIDGDDIRDDKDKIKKQVDFLEENTEYGMCGASTIHYINESGDIIKTQKKIEPYEKIIKMMLITNLFISSSVLVTRKCIDDVGGYIENSLAEDYNLWLKIGINYKMANIDTSIKYRINQQSLGHSTGFKTKRTAFKFVRDYKKYYPNKLLAILIRIFNLIIPLRISEKIAKLIGI